MQVAMDQDTCFFHLLIVTKALADARLKYSDVEQAVVGYCYGKKNLVCVHNNIIVSDVMYY